ncbi:MAG: sigma-70 family RNA polymerase sigma factor, partial [Planctomycetota bacterium]
MTALGSKTLRTQEERDRLVEQFLPLVRYVVARLPVTMPGALDRDDLFSVGVMGLMHAATTYDAARGASFKTFAYTAIRGAILAEVRKLDPVPRPRRDRLRKLNRAQAELAARLDREPTMLELADALQCSEQEIDEDLQALHT